MATVQSYTKAGVDQKLADRSYRVLPHAGGGTPNLASYPDAKSGDIIERNSDGARWNVLSGTLNPETGRVVSVAGKTGIVTLGPTDIGAAPASHTHTVEQITDLNDSWSPDPYTIAKRAVNGRLLVGTPEYLTDATTKAYVDTAVTAAKAWSNLTGKPSTFTPSAHTHTKAQITDLNASTAATYGTIAQRTDNGRLMVGTPVGGADAATKLYVDTAVTNASKWASITGKPGTVSDTINTSNAGAYLVLNSSGRISAGTPTQNSDVANKAYVDAKSWTIDNISDLSISVMGEPNTIAKRAANGRLVVGEPEYLTDATTKTYVDSAVTAAKAWDNLTGVPSTFTPSAHTHTVAQITDLNDSWSPDPYTIAKRTVNGRLLVGTPEYLTDATTKAYVDTAISGKNWSNLSGKPSTFTPSAHTHTLADVTDLVISTSATQDTVAKRIASGRLTVGTPTATTDATTKAYVDSQITSAKAWGNLTGVPSTFAPATHTHTIAQITDLTVATTATANTVAQRTTGGRLVVGTPSANSEATTKAYVDSAVTASKAWANLTGKPSTFPPSSHTHTVEQITDLNVSILNDPDTIAKRAANGRLVVGTPEYLDDATTKAYVDTKFESTLLATQTLNSVEVPGNYFQDTNANATTPRNYPVANRGGYLTVSRSGGAIVQEYVDYLNQAKYIRTKASNGSWQPWKTIAEEPWVGTQSQYNALTNKSANRLYIIAEI